MALINCDECGAEISSKAVSCPKCGNPLQPAARQHQPLSKSAPPPLPASNIGVVPLIHRLGVFLSTPTIRQGSDCFQPK